MTDQKQVPREPTPKMMMAGAAITKRWSRFPEGDALGVWMEMYDAAPTLPVAPESVHQTYLDGRWLTSRSGVLPVAQPVAHELLAKKFREIENERDAARFDEAAKAGPVDREGRLDTGDADGK